MILLICFEKKKNMPVWRICLPSAQWCSRAKHTSYKNSRLFVAWLCSLEKPHHESSIFPTPKLPGSQEPTPAIKHKAIKFYFQKTPAIFSTYISLHPTQSTAKTLHREGKEPGCHIMFCCDGEEAGEEAFPGNQGCSLAIFFYFQGEAEQCQQPWHRKEVAWARSCSAIVRRKWHNSPPYTEAAETAAPWFQLGIDMSPRRQLYGILPLKQKRSLSLLWDTPASESFAGKAQWCARLVNTGEILCE